ncbi:hypothetical protein [Bacillus mojavensis]
MRTKIDRAGSYITGMICAGGAGLAAVNAEWLGIISCLSLAIIFGVVNFKVK